MFEAPPEVRTVAGYLLTLSVGMIFYMRLAFRREATDLAVRSSVVRIVVGSTWGATIASHLLWPELARHWNFYMLPQVRWLTTVPAAIGLLLMIWSLRSELRLDEKGNIVASGPYAWCRYPFDVSLAAFILAVTLLCGNWLLITVTLICLVLHRLGVPFELERVRRARLGPGYEDYATRTGWFLPSAGSVKKSRYQVPTRFSLTAIMGLLTVLAIIFGLLRAVNAHPVIYLFVGSEIVAICLAQILVGSAPRGGSTLTGAILLPFWVYMTLGAPKISPIFNYLTQGTELSQTVRYAAFFLVHALAFSMIFGFGALLGYCIGTLAAGFFLMMDLIEPWLLRDSAASPLPSHELPVQDGPGDLSLTSSPQRKATPSWRERSS